MSKREAEAVEDQQFEIAVRKLADDLRYGQDTSRYIGHGIDYAQSRPFVQGDSVKDIDWRVTARTGRLHLKEYEALKCTPIYLLVDTSASMAFASTPLSKHALSTLIAGGLGLAALERLSPVGVLSVGDRALHLQPFSSRARLFQAVHELRRASYEERTRMTERVEQLEALLRVRHVIIIISDLHEPDAPRAIKRLAQRHDCMVIQIEDPVEIGRMNIGFFRGKEAETGEAFTAHGRSRWFANRRLTPSQELIKGGVDSIALQTDQPFAAPLRQFLMQRGGLMRNTR